MFGRLVLSPNSSLLGLLFAVGGCAALGLVSGVVARRLPLQPGARWELLGACCLVLALLVVFAAMPEPKPCGEIIDAEVRGCTPPGPDETAVLELHILRRRGIFENQKPWNRGKLLARPWQPDDETKSYFARLAAGTCDEYTAQSRSIFYPTSSPPAPLPPGAHPGALPLQVLRPVPEEYLRFAGP